MKLHPLVISIREELESLPRKPEFTAKIIPGAGLIYGNKNPDMRKIAKRIAKGDYKEYLNNNPQEYYEERMIQAFVIGYARDEFSVLLDFFEKEIPYVNNWAVNDALCMDFKQCRKHKAETIALLRKYVHSSKEYEIRVVAVMLMAHFIDDEYIDEVMSILNTLKTDDYYAMMAVAWCAAEIMCKNREWGFNYLSTCTLDNRTYNKAIQKMRESYRVTQEDKDLLKSMKR